MKTARANCRRAIEAPTITCNSNTRWQTGAFRGSDPRLMATREEALSELERVFEMIAAEYRDKGC
jgi:hypothetical protein